MLTGIFIGTGIMLFYLVLIRFAGRKLGHGMPEQTFEAPDLPPHDHR